jgi:hypothetical protein
VREWYVFVEAASPEAASSAAQLLSLYHLDAESNDVAVLCSAESRERAQTLAQRVEVILREAPYPDELGQAEVRCWDEELLRYVDPDAPQQLEPVLQYRVRVRFDRFRDRASVKAIRPDAVIGEGLRHVDFLAEDDVDAQSIAMEARVGPGVRGVSVDPIKGWFRRWQRWFRGWRLRQRLAGNYSGWGNWGNPGGGW